MIGWSQALEVAANLAAEHESRWSAGRAKLVAELEAFRELAREAADDDEPDVKTKTECWIGWRNRMTRRHKALAKLAEEPK